MEKVLQKLPELSNAAGTKDTDLIFLRGLMESPIIQSLPKAQARLEEPKLEAVRERNVELVHEIVEDFAAISQQDGRAAELLNILQEPHFQSLLEVHDSVASRSYEQLPCGSEGFGPPGSGGTQDIMLGEAVRVVGIRKMDGEPLGVTFRVDGGELVIARILRGGAIDRQGLLHVGDVIREVNGHEVAGDPSGLQNSLRDASGSVVLKVLPSYTKPPFSSQIFVKCHFNYDPTTDHLIPCREAGLAFSQGEVLQIVSLDDPSWWQACKMQGGGRVGLVPSQTLEEKRKAYVRSDFDCTSKGNLCGVRGKKKKRMMYVSTKNAEFDQHEILLYEEVANMPPFQRKTLVLIGAQGVGRRSLKNRLIMADPTRYGSTIPCTSRQPRDDEHDRQSYRFVHRSDMEADIKMGAYLESGEYDGNLYGTRIDSIHNVISSGRTCVLDTNTQALKLLRTAEYMPYVVFIAAPPLAVLQAMHRMGLDAGTTSKPLTDNDLKKTSEESNRIQQTHGHYFDVTILNESLEETYKKLLQVLNRLTLDYQWVPVSWVY